MIRIKEILASDNVSDLVNKLNYNFDQVLLHGGGPRGFLGNKGGPGTIGPNGRRGSKWFGGSSDPNTVIVSDELFNNDNYLQSNGSVWTYTNNVWLETSINLKGDTGDSGISDFKRGGVNVVSGSAPYDGEDFLFIQPSINLRNLNNPIDILSVLIGGYPQGAPDPSVGGPWLNAISNSYANDISAGSSGVLFIHSYNGSVPQIKLSGGSTTNTVDTDKMPTISTGLYDELNIYNSRELIDTSILSGIKFITTDSDIEFFSSRDFNVIVSGNPISNYTSGLSNTTGNINFKSFDYTNDSGTSSGDTYTGGNSIILENALYNEITKKQNTYIKLGADSKLGRRYIHLVTDSLNTGINNYIKLNDTSDDDISIFTKEKTKFIQYDSENRYIIFDKYGRICVSKTTSITGQGIFNTPLGSFNSNDDIQFIHVNNTTSTAGNTGAAAYYATLNYNDLGFVTSEYPKRSGMIFNINKSGTGTIASSSSISTIYSFIKQIGTNNVTEIIGFDQDIYAVSGSITNTYGTKIKIINSSTKFISNAYGHYIKIKDNAVGGYITNVYQLYLDTIDGNVISKKYGIYQTGSNTYNYFNGKIGINTLNTDVLLNINGDIRFTNDAISRILDVEKGTPSTSIPTNGTNLYIKAGAGSDGFLSLSLIEVDPGAGANLYLQGGNAGTIYGGTHANPIGGKVYIYGGDSATTGISLNDVILCHNGTDRGGKLGIGINVPTYNIHAYNIGSAMYMALQQGDTNIVGIILGNTDHEYRILNNNVGFVIKDNTESIDRFAITKTGLFGFRTSTPSEFIEAISEELNQTQYIKFVHNNPGATTNGIGIKLSTLSGSVTNERNRVELNAIPTDNGGRKNKFQIKIGDTTFVPQSLFELDYLGNIFLPNSTNALLPSAKIISVGQSTNTNKPNLSIIAGKGKDEPFSGGFPEQGGDLILSGGNVGDFLSFVTVSGGDVKLYGGLGSSTALNGNVILGHTGTNERGKIGLFTSNPTTDIHAVNTIATLNTYYDSPVATHLRFRDYSNVTTGWMAINYNSVTHKLSINNQFNQPLIEFTNSNTITVLGSSSFTAASIFDGTTTFNNINEFNNITTFNATVNFYDDINIYAIVNFDGDVIFNALVDFNDAVIFNSSITLNGIATFENQIIFNGESTFNELAVFENDTTFNALNDFTNTTTFNGLTIFNDDSTFNGLTIFNDNSTFNALLIANNNSYFYNDAVFSTSSVWVNSSAGLGSYIANFNIQSTSNKSVRFYSDNDSSNVIISPSETSTNPAIFIEQGDGSVIDTKLTFKSYKDKTGIITMGNYAVSAFDRYNMKIEAATNITGLVINSLNPITLSATDPTGDLIIGDPSGQHIAFDENQIMCKSASNTPTTLYINKLSGDVEFGSFTNRINYIRTYTNFFTIDSNALNNSSCAIVNHNANGDGLYVKIENVLATRNIISCRNNISEIFKITGEGESTFIADMNNKFSLLVENEHINGDGLQITVPSSSTGELISLKSGSNVRFRVYGSGSSIFTSSINGNFTTQIYNFDNVDGSGLSSKIYNTSASAFILNTENNDGEVFRVMGDTTSLFYGNKADYAVKIYQNDSTGSGLLIDIDSIVSTEKILKLRNGSTDVFSVGGTGAVYLGHLSTTAGNDANGSFWYNNGATLGGCVYYGKKETSIVSFDTTPPSDKRLKTNIRNYRENESILEKFNKLQLVNFAWKTNKLDDSELGLIAQDLEKLFPEMINEFLDEVTIDGEVHKNIKAIDYKKLALLSIPAIQEQQKLIEEKDTKINDLEKRLRLIEEKLGLI